MRVSMVMGVALIGILHCPTIVQAADIPGILAYQGKIAVGGNPYNGTGSFKFALVNADASSTLWSNDGTSVAGSEPTAASSIIVRGGLFSTLLGDTNLTNMTVIPAHVFTNEHVYLRIWFSDGSSGFTQLTPDRRLATAGYAMQAENTNTLEGQAAAYFLNADNINTGTVPAARLPIATTSSNGIVRPDGSTIAITSGGVLSVIGGGGGGNAETVDNVSISASTDRRLTAYDTAGTALADSNVADAVSGNVLSISGTLTAPRSLTLPDTDVSLSSFSATLLDDTNQAAMRSTLGLVPGTDVQAHDAQLNDIAGLTPTDGHIIVGNGSNWVQETGSTAQTSLGLAIGTNVQAYDAQLDDLAALTPTDGHIIVGNGTSWVQETGSTAQASLGLAIGTNVQAYDAQLDDLAGLTPTDGHIIVGNGTNWVQETGSTAQASLGLTIGTHVQAHDAQLDDLAALTPSDSHIIVGNGSNWVQESGATARTSLGLGSAATSAATDFVAVSGDTMTGALTITDSTASTNKDTGALIVTGGAGISGRLHADGGIDVPGAFEGSSIGNRTSTGTLPPISGGISSWELTIGLSNSGSNSRRAGQLITMYNRGDSAGFDVIGSHVTIASVAGGSSAAGKANIGYSSHINAISNATASSDVYGAYLVAAGAANGGSSAYGVYASASGADNNYAGYFSGNTRVTKTDNVQMQVYSATVDGDADVILGENGSAAYRIRYDGGVNSLILSKSDGTNPVTITRDTGVLTISASTASTNKDSGALVIQGGAGIEQNISVGGHIISNASSAPSIGLHASHTAGSGAAVTPSNHTDVAGKLSLNTGTSSSAGNLITVTFASAYQVAPVVILTATDANAAAMQSYVTAVSTTSFTLAVANAPADSSTYAWNYQVIETQ